MGNLFGYARVSTDDQCVDLQVDALKASGCGSIFTDIGASGAKRMRPGLSRALAALSPGDTLVVWKLDRLGRSLSHLIDLVNDLDKQGIQLKSLQEAIDTRSSGGKLFFHMLAALGEFERALISERTIAGQAAARKRGKHLGRPRILTQDKIRDAATAIAKGIPVEELANLYGVKCRTLLRALAKEGVTSRLPPDMQPC